MPSLASGVDRSVVQESRAPPKRCCRRHALGTGQKGPRSIRSIAVSVSPNALIVHDLEAETLALIQAGHSSAFDGAYRDHHVDSNAVGLDESVAPKRKFASSCTFDPQANSGPRFSLKSLAVASRANVG